MFNILAFVLKVESTDEAKIKILVFTFWVKLFPHFSICLLSLILAALSGLGKKFTSLW